MRPLDFSARFPLIFWRIIYYTLATAAGNIIVRVRVSARGQKKKGKNNKKVARERRADTTTLYYYYLYYFYYTLLSRAKDERLEWRITYIVIYIYILNINLRGDGRPGGIQFSDK